MSDKPNFEIRTVPERILVVDGERVDFIIDEDDFLITLPATMTAARAFKAGVFFARLLPDVDSRSLKIRW